MRPAVGEHCGALECGLELAESGDSRAAVCRGACCPTPTPTLRPTRTCSARARAAGGGGAKRGRSHAVELYDHQHVEHLLLDFCPPHGSSVQDALRVRRERWLGHDGVSGRHRCEALASGTGYSRALRQAACPTQCRLCRDSAVPQHPNQDQVRLNHVRLISDQAYTTRLECGLQQPAPHKPVFVLRQHQLQHHILWTRDHTASGLHREVPPCPGHPIRGGPQSWWDWHDLVRRRALQLPPHSGPSVPCCRGRAGAWHAVV